MPENKDKVYTIWDSEPDFEDWKEELQSDYPDLSEDELHSLMYEINGDYLADERLNLSDVKVPNGICCIGDLGLWMGRRCGYPNVSLGQVSDCLRSFCSDLCHTHIYVDEKGELRTRETHHDGTNFYWFRAYKPGVTENQKERLKDLIHSGQSEKAKAYMRRTTYRLGDLIGDVYGWTFPHRPKSSIQATA